MIPRFEPKLGLNEFKALLNGGTEKSIKNFEKAFSKKFNAKSSIAFPYGRSGLYVFIKALKIENAEIIMPSYTCSVVSHAITLTKNLPILIDINSDDFNMNLEKLEQSITSKTKVIIATHLFGYPMNMKKVVEIKKIAEKKFNHKIWLIDDSAHSFGVKWDCIPVSKFCDVSLYGLNISKIITTIYGGMLSFNDEELAHKVRDYWDNLKSKPSILKIIYRKIYSLQCFFIFKPFFYRIIWWLQKNTKILDGITKAYHLDNKISLPKDAFDEMLPFEAEIGICQIKKYDEIIHERRSIAKIYDKNFKRFSSWVFPRFDKEATYSHYTVLVPERSKVIKSFQRNNIELGELIQYSIDEMKCYKYLNQFCPNSRKASIKSINIPLTKAAIYQLKKYKYLARNEYSK